MKKKLDDIIREFGILGIGEKFQNVMVYAVVLLFL
jgi:hypothetical protein